MKIIVPMAGIGKRMRPHTLTTPKPLIPIAGKPIVQWLLEELIRIYNNNIDEIGFVIGNFGNLGTDDKHREKETIERERIIIN